MEEAVQTFMTVTNASRAVAVEKLQAHEGDLNEAINAFFNQEEQTFLQPEHHDARRTFLMEKVEPAEMEVENLFQSLPSMGSFFSPFGAFNRGRASNVFNGQRSSRNSTRHLEPLVSHPRDVREIPIEWNDEDKSAPPHSAPSIVEIPADVVTEHGSEVQGNVIVEDDDIPCTASTVFKEGSYAKDPYYTVIDTDDRDPRPSVPQVTEVPVYSNVGGNATEEEMLQAAIEASRREAEVANKRLQHVQTENILGVGTDKSICGSEDDELAQAVALSLKTAELERALHECEGLVTRQGLGSSCIVTSSQVKLDAEDSSRDGDGLDVFDTRVQEDLDEPEHLLRHRIIQHTPSSGSGDATHKGQDWESLPLSCQPHSVDCAAQQNRDPFHIEEEAEKRLEAQKISVPPEPPAEDEDAVTLLVRLPDGSRCSRRFLRSDRLQSLFNFIDVSGGVKSGTYRLVRQYPRCIFTDEKYKCSLSELGLINKQEALFLELI